MKIINIISGALVLFTFVSCRNENEIKIIDTNTEAETLYGIIQFPVIAKLAADIIEIDSLLVISTPYNKSSIFDVFSKTTGQVKTSFNKRGRGPNEYIQPSIRQSGVHTISLWDKNKVFSEIAFGIDSSNDITFDLLKTIKIEEGGTHLYRLNDEEIISTIHHKGMFKLLNNKGEMIGDYFGHSPLRNIPHEYDLFQGRFTASDSEKLFVFGTYNLGYLCAYDINNNVQPKLKWEFYFDEPSYTLINGEVSWNRNHVQGINDIKIINDKIYVLYSGKSISLPRNTPEGAFADNLYVLNLEGEILKKIKLDIPILVFTLSKIDSAIYGITITMDWQIVKYDLSDVNIH